MRSFKKVLGWMKSHPAPVKWVAFAFAELVILILLLWYATFPPSQWESTPNYAQMYINFIASDPGQAFLCINTGPTGNISWLILLGYGVLALQASLAIAGRRRRTDYIVSNWRYLACLAALALFTISFQNAAQHYDWYWNPAANTPGYVDTWTHTVSSWLICGLSLPFAIERYFGWERKHFWIPPVMIIAFFSIGWELAENMALILNPGSFFNTPINSIQDIIFGTTVGPLLALWMYKLIVMDSRG